MEKKEKKKKLPQLQLPACLPAPLIPIEDASSSSIRPLLQHPPPDLEIELDKKQPLLLPVAAGSGRLHSVH
jgi:hypothetical protein